MQSIIRDLADIKAAKRWDFGFHSPEYLQVLASLDRTYPVARFGDIITVLTDMGAFSLYKTEFFVDEGVPFLRVQNVQEYGVDLEKDTKFISYEYHQQLKKSQLQPGDLLLTTKAVIGVSAVVDENLGDCNISQNLVLIRLKEDINPNYVSVFLNSRLGRMQTETAATGPNQKYLNFERIYDLKITLPSRSLQDHIAQVIQEAYGDRKKKLEEAESLVKGIDDEIKKILEVVVGEIHDEPKFVMKVSDLEDRWDFKVYDRRYVTVINATKEGKYSVLSLGTLCREKPKRGSQPKYDLDGAIPVLKTVNVGSGRIDFESALRVDFSFLETISGKKSKVYKGDILITSTGDGSWGRASVFEEEFDCVVDGHISIVRLKPEHNPHFLAEFLNSSLGQAQFWQRYRGATGQTEIYPDDISALKIATPPKEIQDEIALKVQQRRSQAKQLRAQAEAVVAAAKARVERMILGEETVE